MGKLISASRGQGRVAGLRIGSRGRICQGIRRRIGGRFCRRVGVGKGRRISRRGRGTSNGIGRRTSKPAISAKLGLCVSHGQERQDQYQPDFFKHFNPPKKVYQQNILPK